jgi:predicted transcriptional regulator
MRIHDVLAIIEGEVVSESVDLDREVRMGCGADLMSDVLAFTHDGTLLMTGLTRPQVIFAAEMAGICAIIYVRGKLPPPETIELAEQKGMPLLASKYTMFETCGRLFSAGLAGCGLFESTVRAWREAFAERSCTRAPSGSDRHDEG